MNTYLIGPRIVFLGMGFDLLKMMGSGKLCNLRQDKLSSYTCKLRLF